MSRSRKTWWAVLAVLLCGAAVYALVSRGKSSQPLAPPAPVVENSIVCLGRVQPAGGLFRVAAPSSVGRPCLVAQLLVREGDFVRAGQVLAILDTQSRLKSDLDESEARLELANSRLAQARSGPKQGDIEAAKAEVARIAADLEQARADCERYARLVGSGDIAAFELDSRRFRAASLTASLNAARARLQALSEIRPVDVEVAAGEVASAQAGLARARLTLEQCVVRSPIEGRVVRILTKPGEEVTSDAILSLAYTKKMYVLAEVYESDLRFLKVGRRASIASDALARKIGGTVEKIGMEIGKTTIFPASPAAVTDASVGTAQILLDSPDDVWGLIGAQVTVAIDK